MSMQDRSETEAAAKEILARAKAAREEAKRAEADREAMALRKRKRRLSVLKTVFQRSCVIYTVFCLLHFLSYLIIIFPQSGKTFSAMMLGGSSVIGHALFYATALLMSAVYAFLCRNRPAKESSAAAAYLRTSAFWFFLLQLLTIALYGLYLDMLYNPYAVTDALLFRGPCFLLSFSCLGFALSITLANRILRIQKLHSITRAALHLASLLVLSVLFFYFIAGGFSSGSDLLIFLILFSVLYAACFGVYSAFRKSEEQEANEEQEYENLYMTDALRRQRQAQDALDEKRRQERLDKFRRH